MEQRKVIRAAGLISIFTSSSRALGFIRDVLMAGFFGTSICMSAFVVAFTIPNLFRRLFGEGALSASFIPVFVAVRQREGDAGAWQMAYKVITMLAVLLVGLVVLGWVLIGGAMRIGTLSEKALVILPLLRIMLPYMIFICLAALSMAILNSFRHFAIPAATPCLLNIIWIITILAVFPFLADEPYLRIRAVAWAILIAGVVQLGAQLPVLVRFGYRFHFSWAWNDRRVANMLKLMGPAALGLAVTQFNVLIDRLLASWIGEWAPASLYFSERLIYFPLGIFATALGTVLLPTFSSHAADEDMAGMRETLNHSLRNLMFVMIPAAIGLFVLAFPIIRLCFQWKEFTDQSTWLTAVALQCYAPGLVVFSLAKIFVPAFYGQQDTLTPVKVGVITVVLNIVLNLVFVFTLPVYWKHAGLACATVIAETFYAVVLAVVLQRRLGSLGWRKIGDSAIRAVLVGVIMGLLIYCVYHAIYPSSLLWRMPGKISQMIVVAVCIGVGGLSYLLGALLFCRTEMRDMTLALRR
ncbi:MAG: murein biosynthesis integral membrane protein MurJ [Spartobacteria bacterium]|nr:murein biosynthesis integral membrane protein MurJ [Spartobacteria bacterium]